MRRIAEEVARATVREMFTAMGVDMSSAEKIIQAQVDFAYLRRSRRILYNPANDWVGQTEIEPLCAEGATPRFACFDAPIHGGWAIAVLLQTYLSDDRRFDQLAGGGIGWDFAG